jgi:hypothetical protein
MRASPRYGTLSWSALQVLSPSGCTVHEIVVQLIERLAQKREDTRVYTMNTPDETATFSRDEQINALVES